MSNWKYLSLALIVVGSLACGGGRPQQRTLTPIEGEQMGKSRISRQDRIIQRDEINLRQGTL
jgi:hypothetical protein